MTLEDYIANPMGKNNPTFTPFMRESMKRNYKYKFDNVMLRENGKVGYYLYKDEENNTYYAHLKIPSEVVEKFYYDVVFKFYTTADKNTAGGHNLENYEVQFFANDPAFVFYHAHTYMENGLFLNELAVKMSKDAIKNKATITNPNDSVGYVKSIYFAYLYMKERGLLKLISYKSAQKFDKYLLASMVMAADLKVSLRQEEEKKISRRKKVVVDKGLSRKLNKFDLSDKARSRVVVSTNKTATIKKTKAINTTKKIGKK